MQSIWANAAVAIATFNRNEQLAAVLHSIVDQRVVPNLILVVDNSGDERARPVFDAFVGSSAVALQYIPMPRNSGPAGAFARAVRELGELPSVEWMICRGDDNPFIELDAVERLRSFEQRTRYLHPAAIGFSGGAFEQRTSRSQRIPDHAYRRDVVSVDYIAGAGTPTYHVPTLRAHGINFDPDLFFGFEELDIGLRLGAAGEVLLVDGPRALQQRRRAGRLGIDAETKDPTRRGSVWRSYFSARNRLLVGFTYGRIDGSLRLACRSVAKAIWLLISARSVQESIAIALGVVDGLRGRGRPPRHRFIPEA